MGLGGSPHRGRAGICGFQHVSVIRGLDPRIHRASTKRSFPRRWLAGSSPAMTKSYRSPDAAQRAALRGAVRCRAGAITNAGAWYGPGSAERHEECRTASGKQDRSRFMTFFWHCDLPRFSSRTKQEHVLGNQPSMVSAENSAPKGLAMLIRSKKCGIWGEAARAVGPAIPAASLPTLLLGGLLLLIGP